ncbi:uncharacterized protein LOC112044397 isoform X2 [Bicyclus anynana]|uniref:Uncharacterized protein LOC112044397 isoform X2 n=1 Tax=Bicyclus anynana TaxID=110368 RepID=A0A6J1MKI4_BICAN|nr:uncharacterized protein LOC112044397 isoform X2 [Bicyclus anynana]
MTRYVTVALVLSACVLFTSAQYNNFAFGYDNYLATNFGPPNLGGLSAAATRDSRSDRGPVVFPPSPSADNGQTSGVVIGASGYGFQAPGSQGAVVPRYFYRGFYGRR